MLRRPTINYDFVVTAALSLPMNLHSGCLAHRRVLLHEKSCFSACAIHLGAIFSPFRLIAFIIPAAIPDDKAHFATLKHRTLCLLILCHSFLVILVDLSRPFVTTGVPPAVEKVMLYFIASLLLLSTKSIENGSILLVPSEVC